jgi:mRNA interferase RelE/StbE
MNESGPRWNVIFTWQAEMALHRLSRQALQDIDQAILALAENPRLPDCQELIGDDNLYRLGVGEWRITYAVEEDHLTVLVLEIAPKQRPGRYRLAEEMEQAPWSEEAENPDQASHTRLEEMLRANLLYHAFKAFGCV